jgi:hypothetical protein
MGGQACVFYGAAEFSRDTDFAILASPLNLARLRDALKDLQARVIAVPPFEARFLRRGHAIHFRCRHPEALGMRIDIMSRMRGVAPFPKLWARRTTIELPDGSLCDLLSLPDLVQAKKTQRDKDWVMLRRLLEAHFFQNRKKPTAGMARFWLRELRTPELLIEVAQANRRLFSRLAAVRPLLALVAPGKEAMLAQALKDEEEQERERDRQYWLPLKSELETLRRSG